MHKILSPVLLLVTLWMCGCTGIPYQGGLYPFGNRNAPKAKQGQSYARHIAGIIHERQGALDKAVANYTQVIRRDGKAVTPRLRLLRAYLRLGQNQEALLACKEALEQIPSSHELWIAFAELNHSTGNIDEAVNAIKKAIALRPEDLSGYGALVELQEKTNDLVAAIEIYEKLIERSPDSAALYYQLGINLTRIGDNESAKNAFSRVLELEPQVARARLLLALVYFDLTDYENSAAQLRAYLQDRPDDATALEYYAATQYRLGLPDNAQLSLERMVNSGEAGPRNHLQFAWVLLELGDMEQSQQHALEGSGYLLADLIFALANLNQAGTENWTGNPWEDRYTLEEIETETDLILEALPALYGKREVPEAFCSKLQALSEKFGFSPPLEFLRGRMLLYAEKYEEALACFESLLQREVQSKHIHYHCAVIHEKLKNISKAENHLLDFIKLDPDDPDVLNYLGYLYAENDLNLDKAEALLQRALALDPDNPYYLDSLGWVYYKQGKGEEAARLIRRAIYGMENDDAVLRDHLGDIYLLLGDKERAVAEWRHALRLDPSLETIREKIERHALPKE
ncbi:MAG: tetratricopeptide repeat protein [Candidatus Hydrogenedentes bacterium]|nr:tetratricopeptide repeat protein [Candidatus Hydrogenedentota bacterium]